MANEIERMRFMQQVYTANQNLDMTLTKLDTQIKFFLNNSGRLYQIIWYYGDACSTSWQKENKEKWDLEEANEYDLNRAFMLLALGNPKDFKALYYALKEHDEVVFPIIADTLKEIQETFNFN